MQTTKRIGAFLTALALAAGLALASLPLPQLALPAAAIPARSDQDQYFGKQLTGADRAFYDALVAMYAAGTLQKGSGDHAVTLDAAQVQGYLNGTVNLGSALSTARDAFYMDYPDLFYVDFNNFALRAKNEGGGTKIYITPGRRAKGYLLDSIQPDQVTGMVSKYDAALKTLVDGARAAQQKSGEHSPQAAQVRSVHDALAKKLTYKLDDECQKANLPYIRTAYGIVTGEGVCEAYARAFKSAMDELDIPCVLVEGVYNHSAEVPEGHLWACVQLEKAWYGVDVTMDDPDHGATVYTDYLLAGAMTMDTRHVPSAVMSAADHAFDYPALTDENYYVEVSHNANGLVVKLDTAGSELEHREDGGGSGTFHVSYKGMDYDHAAAQGYYMLARFLTVDTSEEGNGEWVTTNWGYLNPALYDGIMTQNGSEIALPMPHVRYAEFGVTDIPPAGRDADAYAQNNYQGDPTLLLATSGMIENKGATYVAPPYIKRAVPGQDQSMTIGQTYHVKVTFDDRLKPAEEGAELGYDLESYIIEKGKQIPLSAEQYCTITKPVLSEDKRTVTFDFTPSKQWAHDTIFYTFTFTGVVGEQSGKAPNTLTYLARNACSAYKYQSQGFDWNLYAKPRLMDDFRDIDLSGENWETNDDTDLAKLSAELKHRMTLVVTESTPAQSNAMQNELKSKGLPGKVIDSYSINLTVCKSQIVRTGQSVRVMLGFPEGYGPDDAGITFKAYHYSKDDYGNITGVNEIPCIVTPYGLLVLCDSFSPFSLAAVNSDAGQADGQKTVIVSHQGGGSVTASGVSAQDTLTDGVYTIRSGGSYTYAIRPAQGNVIESVTVDGAPVTVSAQQRSGMDISLSYAQMKGRETGIIDVKFANADWVADHGQDVEPTLPKVSVSLPARLTVEAGKALDIEATVTTSGGNSGDYQYSYEWSVDGKELTAHSGKTLHISKAEASHAGQYRVTVTLTAAGAGARSTASESAACAVTVKTADGQAAAPAVVQNGDGAAAPPAAQSGGSGQSGQSSQGSHSGMGGSAHTDSAASQPAGDGAAQPDADGTTPVAVQPAPAAPAQVTAPEEEQPQNGPRVTLPVVIGVFACLGGLGGITAGLFVWRRRAPAKGAKPPRYDSGYWDV